MIRKATEADLNGVLRLYDEMHDAQEAGLICTNWKRGIYPSRVTAIAALERNNLFVTEENGRIIGSGIINHAQLEIYAGAAWEHTVPDEQVCVLHTMMISPAESGKGHARDFLAFYEQYALEHSCPELRIDTSEINTPARAMYRKHGYHEIGIATQELNGIPNVSLVMLEKYLGESITDDS
ncbi:MAG: GNAT family N-acetyltransferase [Clostridia bacterium]|nr:GNAT family N-acetyltransferase [Clostridia bacterium]